MRVRLIADQLGPNPQYDRRRPVSDANPINVVVPAGTEIEDPEAIYLVINDQAEPIDDEAKQAYARFIDRKEKALQARGRGQRPAIPFPAPAPAPTSEAPQQVKSEKPEPVQVAPASDPEPEPEFKAQQAEQPASQENPPASDAPSPPPHPAARTAANVTPDVVTPQPLRGLQDLADAA